MPRPEVHNLQYAIYLLEFVYLSAENRQAISPESHVGLLKTEYCSYLLFVIYSKACYIPQQLNPDTNILHKISYMKTLSYLL